MTPNYAMNFYSPNCLFCIFPHSKHRSFLLILLIAFSSLAFSQTNIGFPYLFESVNVSDGLSHNTVTSFAQDQEGFIWIGTYDGLNRYDGQSVKVFKNDPQDRTSLANNSVWALCADRDGDIWIGGTEMTISRYSPKTGIFYHYELDIEHNNKSSIRRIIEDQSGNIWVATQTNGFFKITKDNIRQGINDFKKYSNFTINGKKEDLSFTTISDFIEDEQSPGIFWIAQNEGLSKFDASGNTFTHYFHADKIKDGNIRVFMDLSFDNEGQLWIVTSKDLIKFDPKTEEHTTILHKPGDPYSLMSNTLNEVFKDQEGSLWISSWGKGLHRLIDTKTEKFLRFVRDPSEEFNLSTNNVYSFFQDRAGIIWIGSSGGGAIYLDLEKHKFELFQKSADPSKSLSGSNLSSVLEDSKGAIWLGSRTGGLDRMIFESKDNVSKHSVTNFSASPLNAHSLSDNSITAILEDHQGLLIISTVGGVIDVFDPQTERFRSYLNEPGDLRTPNNSHIFCMIEDHSNNLWMGTHEGFYKYDRLTRQFTHFCHDNLDPENNDCKTVTTIYEDADHNLWLGSYTGGLIKFNPSTGVFKSYSSTSGCDICISNDLILSFAVDQQGMYWIGTWGGGLIKLDPQSETFTTYTTADGLVNDVIYSIVEDDLHKIWVSTNNGISRFDPAKNTFQNFSIKDGLQGDEFNSRVGLKSKKNGNIFFGGVNGLNKFDPQNFSVGDSLPTKILISGLTRFRNEKDNTIAIEEKGIMDKESISLSYLDHSLSFSLATLNFKNGYQNQYSYRLVGLSNNWINLGNKNTINFNLLPPGNYTLEARASVGDGMWSEDIARLKIKISPPWWKTKLAYFFYIAMVLAGLYLFYLNRVRQLTKYQKLRTKISSDLHDDVGTVLAAVAMQSEFLGVGAKKEKVSEFQNLSKMARMAMDGMRDTVWAIDSRKDNIDSLIDRMSDFLNNYFVNSSFSYTLDQSTSNTSSKIAPDIRQNFFFVFKEAVYNAVKHSNGNHIQITFHQDSKKMLLSVKDNGHVDQSKIQTSGTGLSNMRMRAERIGADLEIKMEDGFEVIMRK